MLFPLYLLHGGDLRSAGLITPKVSLCYGVLVYLFLLVKGKFGVLVTVKNGPNSSFAPSHVAFCQPRRV